MKAGSSTLHQTETNNLMTRHEVDHNVFDFNATVDDHGLDDGMDADAGIDSAHSAAAVDPDSDAILYFSDFDIEYELDGIAKDNDDDNEDNNSLQRSSKLPWWPMV